MSFSSSISVGHSMNDTLNDSVVIQVCWWSSALVSTISVVFGLVSWTILPKWRQFRHYVLINLLLHYSLPLVGFREFVIPLLSPSFRSFMSIFAMLSFMHWLMIATIVFYVDCLKIFRTYKERVYLKANVLGWLLPLVWAALARTYDFLSYGNAARYFTFSIGCTVPLINCVMYYHVICALRVSRSDTTYKTLIMSTYVFLLNGVTTGTLAATLLVNILSTSNNRNTSTELYNWYLRIYHDTLYAMTMWSFHTSLSTNVFFLMLKTHRELWFERKHKQAEPQ